MRLPVMPPVKPMLAKACDLNDAELLKWIGQESVVFEPKWDGFRCIVFRDGDDVVLGSRNEKPLTRYFPEVVDAVLANLPDRCVVDGEIVIAGDKGLEFETLQQRIHPADSRVRLLAEQTPASFVAFDLLALGDEDLTGSSQQVRRTRLEEALSGAKPPIHLTQVTTDPAVAREWFATFEGAGLDGVMAKPLVATYQHDKRVMKKIKHARTADCVVAGYRWHKSGPVVGSLMLGLYDEAGNLNHVGVAASFPMARRAELVAELEPHLTTDEDHPWAGAWAVEQNPMKNAGSRWNNGKDLSFVALRPELVVEVGYDHMEGRRFRHTTQFKRWRTDRSPESCTYAQLEVPVTYDLGDVLR